MIFRLLHIVFFISFSSPGFTQVTRTDSLKQIIALGNNDVEEIKAYNLLAEEYIRLNVPQAKGYLYLAIGLGKKLQNPRMLSNSYSQMVTIFHNQGRLDSADFYLSALEKLAVDDTSPDINIVRGNYYSTAGLYYKRAGNLKMAIPFFIKSIELANKAGNKTSAAGQSLNLGNVYMLQGDYRNALEYHLKALKFFEEAGNQRGISFSYQNISNSFLELKQYDQALKYAEKSIGLKKQLNDRRGLGTSYNSLGQVYLEQGKLDKALQYFNAALAIAREFKLVPEEVKNIFNIGKVYAAKKEVNSATEFYNQAKDLAIQIADSASIAAIEVQVAALRNDIASKQQTEKKLESSLEQLKTTGNMSKQADGYKSMADFYTANGEYEKALHFTNLYHRFSDSLLNNELQLQLKKMEEQYMVEKKEKEIALLKKDQQLQLQRISQQRYFLIGAVSLAALALAGIWLLVSRNRMRQRMKELQLRTEIAADLHDEVGSSLSSIYMLSEMASGKQDQSVSQKEILSKVTGYSKETMEKMGDIVWMIKPDSKEGAGLKERMERFLYELCNSRGIGSSFEADTLSAMKLSMARRKALYLVFKESVNNAVKYSGAKNIKAMIRQEARNILLQVTDDGNGFDMTTVRRGNGLQNMQTRAAELQGEASIVSAPGKGTTVLFSLPV